MIALGVVCRQSLPTYHCIAAIVITNKETSLRSGLSVTSKRGESVCLSLGSSAIGVCIRGGSLLVLSPPEMKELFKYTAFEDIAMPSTPCFDPLRGIVRPGASSSSALAPHSPTVATRKRCTDTFASLVPFFHLQSAQAVARQSSTNDLLLLAPLSAFAANVLCVQITLLTTEEGRDLCSSLDPLAILLASCLECPSSIRGGQCS